MWICWERFFVKKELGFFIYKMLGIDSYIEGDLFFFFVVFGIFWFRDKCLV